MKTAAIYNMTMESLSGIQNNSQKYRKEDLTVVLYKFCVYCNKNIKKYVKFLPADNIHERNIKGGHLR